MKSLLLKLDDELTERASQAARETGTNRHAWIVSLIQGALGDLDTELILGFVELSRGEALGAPCPQCDAPMKRVFVGFTSGASRPQTVGPMCQACATVE